MSVDHNKFADDPTQPSRNPFEVSPDDNADLARVSKALYVGTGGAVVLRAIDGGTTDVTFANVPSGTTLEVAAKRVLATGTTASDIVAL